jgi:hypothetical protein
MLCLPPPMSAGPAGAARRTTGLLLGLLTLAMAGCPLPAPPGLGPDEGPAVRDGGGDRNRPADRDGGRPSDLDGGGDPGDLTVADSDGPLAGDGADDRPGDVPSEVPPALDTSGGDATANGDISSPDGVTSADAGAPNGIDCLNAGRCQPGQICCLSGTTGTDPSGTCVTQEVSCNGGAVLHCDGPEDCGGQICCATAESGAPPRSDCNDSCGGSNQFEICHTDQDCTAAAVCCPVSNYGVCASRCQ